MKIVRIVAILVALLCTFFAGIAVSHCFRGSQEITIRQLEKLSHLVALRVQVADVLKGTVGSVSGVWLVKGDALISVDLSRAEIVQQDRVTRHVTVRLPQPQVFQPRVDHERTQTYDVKRGWFSARATEDRLRDESMLHAQKLIETAARGEEYQRMAREHTHTLMQLFFEGIGWTVVVVWQPHE